MFACERVHRVTFNALWNITWCLHRFCVRCPQSLFLILNWIPQAARSVVAVPGGMGKCCHEVVCHATYSTLIWDLHLYTMPSILERLCLHLRRLARNCIFWAILMHIILYTDACSPICISHPIWSQWGLIISYAYSLNSKGKITKMETWQCISFVDVRKGTTLSSDHPTSMNLI